MKKICEQFSNSRFYVFFFFVFLFFFLIFFFPVNESANSDEWGFFIPSRGLKTVKSYAIFVGKGPVPLYLNWVLIKIFGTDLRVGQFIGASMGALSACLVIELSRLLGFSRWGATALILGSAFFYFYARTVMFEIYVIFFTLLAYLGEFKSRKNLFQGTLIVFVATFLGILTRTSVLIGIALVPVLSFFENQRAPLLQRAKLIVFLSAGIGFAILGALGFFSIFGMMESVHHLHTSCVAPIGIVISRIFQFKHSWAYQAVFLDMGWGAVFGFFLSTLLIAIHYPLRAFVGVFIVIGMIEYLSNSAIAGPFSRYLISVWPVTFILTAINYSKIQNKIAKRIVLTTIVLGQMISVVQTTYPLGFNPAQAKWAPDEFEQHHGTLTNYGWHSLQNQIDQLVKTHGPIQVKCANKIFPENQQFSTQLCSYLLARNDEKAPFDRSKFLEDPRKIFWIIVQRSDHPLDPGLKKIFEFDRTIKGDPFDSSVIIAEQ